MDNQPQSPQSLPPQPHTSPSPAPLATAQPQPQPQSQSPYPLSQSPQAQPQAVRPQIAPYPQPNPASPQYPAPNSFNPAYRPQYVSPPPFSAPQPSAPVKIAKSSSHRILPLTLAVFLLIVAIASVVFAVINMLELKKYHEQNKTLEYTAKVQSAIIKKVSENAHKEIKTPDDVPMLTGSKENLYFSSWGVSIRTIPDLANLSYVIDNKSGFLCFTGTRAGTTNIPDFANIGKNRWGLGCLRRVAASEGPINKASNLSYGDLIKEFDGFNYFYVAPAKDFSQDPAELTAEKAVIPLIRQMLTENLSSF